MSVGRICCREVHLARADETAAEAARWMKDKNVGTLVVVDEKKRPIGLVTDRDLTVRVLAEGRAPTTTVEEVMTGHPRTVEAKTPIEDALAMMRRLAVRRLPVVNGAGVLVGLISVDDVLSLLAEEFGSIGGLLRAESPREAALEPI